MTTQIQPRVRAARARSDIVRERESQVYLRLIVSGWACRYRVLEDGRRQIIGFLLPGDVCDLGASLLPETDHSIGALTAVRYVNVPHETMDWIMTEHPLIRQAMWRDMLASSSVLREWIVSLGQRTALERIGHLFCELFARLSLMSLTYGTRCEMPITQSDIADATGVTTVHVNRMVQILRDRGLITLRSRVLDIPDLPALRREVLFANSHLSPRYRWEAAVKDGPQPVNAENPKLIRAAS